MSLSATFVLSSTIITCPVIAFISTRIVFPSPMLHRRRIDRYLTFSFRHEFHKTKLQYSFFKAVVPSIFTRPPIYADTLSRANRSIPLHSTYSNFKGSTSPAVMARKTVERFPRVHAPRRASLGASRRLYLARLVSTLCHPSERSSVDSWHHFDSASRSAIVRSRVSVLPRHCCLDHASSSLSSVSLHFRRPIPLRQEELLFAPQTTCGFFFLSRLNVSCPSDLIIRQLDHCLTTYLKIAHEIIYFYLLVIQRSLISHFHILHIRSSISLLIYLSVSLLRFPNTILFIK